MSDWYDAARKFYKAQTGSKSNAFGSLATAYFKMASAGTLPAATLPDPSASVKGGVKTQTAIANVTPATDGTAVGTAFNTLLAELRTAKIIAP